MKARRWAWMLVATVAAASGCSAEQLVGEGSAAGGEPGGGGWWEDWGDDWGAADSASYAEGDDWGGGWSGAADAGSYGGGEGGEAAGPGGQVWNKTASEVPFASVSLGGGAALELRKVRVVARIEGLRARVLVDHIFYNPYGQAVEGTFRYPLPTEASVSYFGMFLGDGGEEPRYFGGGEGLDAALEALSSESDPAAVAAAASGWGELREGRVVRKVEGTKTYEELATKQVDPALVEEVSPGSFEARVYPIQASGHHRILIAYEQTLPRVGDALDWRMALPKGPIEDLSVRVLAPKDLVSAASSAGDLPLAEQSDPAAHALGLAFTGESPGGTAAVRVTPVGMTDEAVVLAGTDPTRQEDWFVARLTPALPPTAEGDAAGASTALFALDTSFSEHPDRFAVDVALMEAILEASPEIERFNALSFDVGARWLDDGWLPNTKQGRAEARAAAEAILLEGATDVDAALRALTAPPGDLAGAQSVDVFLMSDGVLSWGDTSVEAMAARFEVAAPFEARVFAYRTGLSAENLALFAALTRKGAVFNCLTADSVAGCAKAHRAPGMAIGAVQVLPDGEAGAQTNNLLVAGRQATLFDGGDLLVAGRLLAPGPAIVRVSGWRGGEALTVDVPVQLVPAGELAPRAWAEVAVASLLATHAEDLEDIAVALAQHFRIASSVTSFLVLEEDAQYDQFALVDESGAFVGQGIAALVEAAMDVAGAPQTTWDALMDVFTDWAEVNQVLDLRGGQLVDQIVAAVDPAELELPSTTPLTGASQKAGANAAYVASMTHVPGEVDAFTAEADRRMQSGDLIGAVRTLSTVIENAPSSAELARMVGYRLTSAGLGAPAAAILMRVLRARPFEPQSYRDLANALWTARPALAALLFEAAFAGEYAPKYALMHEVVGEEYGLLAQALEVEAPSAPLTALVRDRVEELGLAQAPSDIRVTMTWNTDNTDIDLWVTDPTGERCYYAHPALPHGGSLFGDLTQGYGPERFTVPTGVALPGQWTVQVHYFGNNGVKLFAETYVNVTVVRHAGTAKQKVERFDVLLRHVDDVVTVTSFGM